MGHITLRIMTAKLSGTNVSLLTMSDYVPGPFIVHDVICGTSEANNLILCSFDCYIFSPCKKNPFSLLLLLLLLFYHHILPPHITPVATHICNR